MLWLDMVQEGFAQKLGRIQKTCNERNSANRVWYCLFSPAYYYQNNNYSNYYLFFLREENKAQYNKRTQNWRTAEVGRIPCSPGSPGAGFVLNLTCFTDDKTSILQASTLVSLLKAPGGSLQQISPKLISPNCFPSEIIL